MRGKVVSERRIRGCPCEALGRSSHEEAAGCVVAAQVSLELNRRLAEGRLHQLVESAGDPRSVDLKLHDKEPVGLQQLFCSLESFASVDIVVDANNRFLQRSPSFSATACS